MVSKITDLNIGEVSLVDRAAIRRKFLLFKAEGDSGDDLEPTKNQDSFESLLLKAGEVIVERLLQAQQDWRVEQEFIKALGCTWDEWKTLSKAEQERRQDNFNARGQIEHLDGRLDELAAEIKEREPKLTYEQAYLQAMANPDGQEICRRLNTALALRR